MNLMKASGPLRSAIGEAESELGIRIRQVVVGLPRYRVTQETANGRVERSTPDDYITREEVETLKSIAVESYPLDDMKNQIIYGAIAQSFSNELKKQVADIVHDVMTDPSNRRVTVTTDEDLRKKKGKKQ